MKKESEPFGIREPSTVSQVLTNEFMKPLGLTQTDLAIYIQVPRQRINQIIQGKRNVTPDTAFRLAALFGTTADFWMMLQVHHDLWKQHQIEWLQYKTIKRYRK